MTGALPRFRDTRVASLREWLDELPALDVTGDGQLRQVADRARNVLDGVPDAQALRDDATFRAAIAGKFEQVREALNDLGVSKAAPRQFRGKAKRKAG
jgi:hypothetical protein